MGKTKLTTSYVEASTFYSNVFNWSFAPSSLGIPEEKLLTFTVPGNVFAEGGVLRRVDETDGLEALKGIKLYLYVDDIGKSMESIVKYGGKKVSDVIPEGSKGFFRFFQDPEGNDHAIYTFAN